MKTRKQIKAQIVILRKAIDDLPEPQSTIAYIMESTLYWVIGRGGSPSKDIDLFSAMIKKSKTK